jgi:hypothetical protein
MIPVRPKTDRCAFIHRPFARLNLQEGKRRDNSKCKNDIWLNPEIVYCNADGRCPLAIKHEIDPSFQISKLPDRLLKNSFFQQPTRVSVFGAFVFKTPVFEYKGGHP